MYQNEHVYTIKSKRTGKFFMARSRCALLPSTTVHGPSQESFFFRFHEMPNGRVLIESVAFPGLFVTVQPSSTVKNGLMLNSGAADRTASSRNTFILSLVSASQEDCSAARAQLSFPKQTHGLNQHRLTTSRIPTASTTPSRRNDVAFSTEDAIGQPTPAPAPERNSASTCTCNANLHVNTYVRG